jgi:hypothetical protein
MHNPPNMVKILLRDLRALILIPGKLHRRFATKENKIRAKLVHQVRRCGMGGDGHDERDFRGLLRGLPRERVRAGARHHGRDRRLYFRAASGGSVELEICDSDGRDGAEACIAASRPHAAAIRPLGLRQGPTYREQHLQQLLIDRRLGS